MMYRIFSYYELVLIYSLRFLLKAALLRTACRLYDLSLVRSTLSSLVDLEESAKVGSCRARVGNDHRRAVSEFIYRTAVLYAEVDKCKNNL